MAPKVDEDLIERLREVCPVSREDAKNAIRSNDFDLERAIDYILTGGMEQDKAAERNSSSSRGVLDTIKHYTRSKSPLKNRKSSPSTSSTEVLNSSALDEEEEQLRLALEMSLQDSEPNRARTPDAPSGQLSTDKSPYFGPARDVDYNDGTWGIVLKPKDEQESGIVDDTGKEWSTTENRDGQDDKASPDERKRIPGQPVVLDTKKCHNRDSTSESTVVGLLMILYQISTVREAFLLAAPRNPGNDNDPQDGWWEGKEPLRGLPLQDGVDVSGESVLRECARIMTFLDDTERNFGNVGDYLIAALKDDVSKLPIRGNAKETEISPSMFLQRWTYIVENNFTKTFLAKPLPDLFLSTLWQPSSTPTGDDFIGSSTELDILVPRKLTDAGLSTILDAIEQTMWFGDAPASIKSFSEVLLIQFRREDHEGGAGVEILPKLPMGRFAHDFYELAVEKLRLQSGLQQTLKQLQEKQQGLKYVEKMGKKIDSTKVLRATIQYISEMEGKKITDGETDDEDVGTRMDIDNEATLPRISTLLEASLETLIEETENIQSSIHNMEQKLSELMHFPDTITRRVTSDNSAELSETRTISCNYILRGIVVDQCLTFFSIWEPFTNPYKKKLLWFRCNISNQIEVTLVEEGDVLTIARDRGRSGILTVYAREDVSEVVDKVLPPDYLSEFIQRDNDLFQKELNPPVIHVTRPPEDESMDTEDASAPPLTPTTGTSPRSLNPFLNRDGPVVEEVDEMDMDVDDNVSLPLGETNPFRMISGEQAEKRVLRVVNGD